jgi:hypothetical protein
MDRSQFRHEFRLRFISRRWREEGSAWSGLPRSPSASPTSATSVPPTPPCPGYPVLHLATNTTTTNTPHKYERASSTNKQPPRRVSVANGFCLVTSPRSFPHFFVAYRRRTGSPKPRGISRTATAYKEISDPTPKSTLSVPRQPTSTSARDCRAA